MRLAILGGSFNPVHVGHLFLADAVISSLNYDMVILVPAFESPFKPGAEGAPPKDRLDMLASSITADPRLTIDDCEIRREGVSYTFDTIAGIKARYRLSGKPGLILGDDLASSFYKWKNASVIAEETDIIMARRVFGSANAEKGGFNPAKDFPYPYTELDNELMNVSSRLVREKIRNGENWRYLVPEGARIIIEARGLYGFEKSVPSVEKIEKTVSIETTALIESAARIALSSSRFLHSRNTAVMARELAASYGLDPLAGYLAGIAHDMCKSLKEGELARLARLDGKELSSLEKKKPGLLHGRAAAVLLKERYGITDTGILDAVRFHVTCDVGMGSLAKVLYIADKLEVSREWVPPRLKEMLGKAPLEDLFAAVLLETVAYLRSNRQDISYSARRLLSFMEKKKENDKKAKS